MTYTTPLLTDLGTIEEMTADKGQGPTDGFMADIPIGDASSAPRFTGDAFPARASGVVLPA